MNRLKNSRPAFSLIELMVVILIIALIVAILLPALGGVRQKARDAATRNLLQNLSQSFAAFEIDNKRLPGYFPESALGAGENGRNGPQGLTSLENALFELAGGIDPTLTTAPPEYFKVGPYADASKNVFFNRDLVGKGKYFVPPAQHYKFLDGSDVGRKSAAGTPGTGATLPTGNLGIQDLVDADGMPILAWMSDPGAIGPIGAIADLAYEAPRANGSSRFYTNSNYAMLDATRLGKKGVNQQENSLIGTANNANAAVSLAAVLGSPGSPKSITPTPNLILPTAARGSFILQAAGKNGIYVGKGEAGGARAVGDTLFYGLTFKNMPNAIIEDSDGKPTSSDLLKDFDDIVVSGGG
jgi:prepilin-type N-terminal cleavage/methylation domain-containing protein